MPGSLIEVDQTTVSTPAISSRFEHSRGERTDVYRACQPAIDSKLIEEQQA